MYKTLKNSITFDHNGGEKELKLPGVVAKNFRLRATDWQVTDVGIVAAETLGGAITEVEIKHTNKSKIREIVFYCYDDEYDEVTTYCEAVSPLSKGPITQGLYSDPMPTTATAEDSWWTYYGPFDWRGKATLRIKVAAFTTEWAAASAGTVTFEIDYEEYTGNIKPIRVTREDSSSSTGHTVYGAGINKIKHTFLVAGTADYLSRVTINEEGTTILDEDVPQKFAADYDLETRSAIQATCTKYLLKNLNVLHSGNREFIIKMSTAATLVAYFFGY